MYEKRGTTEFYYYYDSFGNLAGIKYYLDGTQYMVYAIGSGIYAGARQW